jgi:tetratricopeptide (TPR) repeat protein
VHLSKAQRASMLQEALGRHRNGDLAGAIAAYRQLLAASPTDADALNLLGVALHQSGERAGAIECLRLAVKSRRKDPALHYNLGTLLLDAADPAGAESALRTALTLGSREPHLEMNLANAIALQGRAQQALPLYQAATRRAPRSAGVWFNYGNALRDLGDLEQAAAAYRKATGCAPADARAWVNLGNVLHRLQQLDGAEQAYLAALAAGAEDGALDLAMAQLLLHRAQPAQALELADRALVRDANGIEARCVRADILRALYRFDAAEATLCEAQRLDPENAAVRMRLADLMRDTGRAGEALAHYDALLVGASELRGELTYKRAVACMHLRAYADAWAGMQARVARERLAALEPAVAWSQQPLPADLAGATVLVVREQGLGDELLYLRFMPLLRARGARVRYRCGAKLRALLERAGAADEIDPELPGSSAADYRLAVGDLPWALGAGVLADPVPPALPLQPLAERVASMRAHLAAAGPAPYIGLTWRAGTATAIQQGIKGRVLSKQVDPAELGAALRATAGTLVILQRGLEAGEIERLEAACGRQAHDFGAWNEALDDAIALLAALDDYIGVSNTNMHLLAAIGRNARVLLHFPPDWRWLAPAGESPFFPGFRLYPQAPDGSWHAALMRLKQDLSP